MASLRSKPSPDHGQIGPALLASSAAVILGAIGLEFAELAVFATAGPPMAICVAVTVAVSLTFTPALMRWLDHA